MSCNENQPLTPASVDASRKPRCTTKGEVERLYALRDSCIASFRVKGFIDAIDLLLLERSGRCIVANEDWSLCTKEARNALLNDSHHFVRSCAAIAASQASH